VLTKFKYFCLTLALLTVQLSLPVQANLQPMPHIDLNPYGYFNPTPIPDGDDSATVPLPRESNSTTISDFHLEIYKTEAEIRDIIAEKDTEVFQEIYEKPAYEFVLIPIDEEHQLLQIMLDMRMYFGKGWYPELTDRSKAYQSVIYYLLKNGVSIGYCAIERIGIYDAKKFEPYRQILSVTENAGYLKQDLLQVPKKTLRFFDMPRQDTYTERYATLNLKMNPKELASQSLSHTDYILLRAFYPSQFEAVFAPYIRDAVNDHLQKFGTWQTD